MSAETNSTLQPATMKTISAAPEFAEAREVAEAGDFTEARDFTEVSAQPLEGSTFAPPACPVCAGTTRASAGDLFDTRFGIPGSFEVRRCQDCGLERLSPAPAAAELKEFYERFYNFSGERATFYTFLREWFFSSFLYRLWMRVDGDISFHLRKGGGRLLDIGCNEGRTLKNYARNGFDAEGVELNEKAAALARAAGFRVFTGSLEDLAPQLPYDVAVLSNVLEHALDPGRMLREVHRLVKPQGQVWISCPNRQSWLRGLFGRMWINWHVPFHISHFSPRTLRKLVEESGFSEVRIRQITPALWVASSILAGFFARPGRPTKQLRNAPLIFGLVLLCRALLFPVLFWGNRTGRGDCLVAVATRAE
ncbi:MAG: class I SAM-dependent methyltransferase [Candidatus Sulfotelmatobacter sp.]